MEHNLLFYVNVFEEFHLKFKQPMTRFAMIYGINYFNNQSARVRWGFAWNNETDENTNDVSGGIGMSDTYQSFSAGDIINCCEINQGINRSARVEVYIR